MTALLVVLSVLALWTLLAELVVGLLLIFKCLEAIRGMLSRILAGVRAIERESQPLERLGAELPAAGTELASALARIAGRGGRAEVGHA